MGLLTSLLTGTPLLAGTPNPISDFWYGDIGGGRSAAGPLITQDTAMTISAVYACVDKLAKAAMISPCHLNVELPPDAQGRPQGIRRASEHWLYRLIHDAPNERQTAPEFWAQVRAFLALRGAFFARKIFGRGDEIVALDPMHPDRVEVRLLDNRRRGFLVAPVGGGAKEPLTQDEVFCVIGLSLDGGKTGVSVLKYARETFGRSIATEDFASRTFSQGALHRLSVASPGRLSDAARKNLKQSILDQTAGQANWHHPLILEEGLQVKEVSMTPEDTQMLLSRRFSVADVARWFDVPLVMINETDRSTSWGSGIEQLMKGFVTWACLPWFSVIEAAIERDLIPERERPRLSAKFLVDALLRATTADRFSAYSIGIMSGFMSENEVRVREDLDPIPGLWEPRRSANQDRGGDPTAPRPAGPPERRPMRPMDDEDDDERARAAAIVLASAGRLVRKEVATLRTQAARRQGEDWRRFVTEFYGRHVDALTAGLCLAETEARAYGAEHCAALLERGVSVFAEWEREAPAALAATARGR